MSDNPTTIVIEDEDTWPAGLSAELATMHEALNGYELEEQAIFREYSAPSNTTPMALMRGNRFDGPRAKAVERINELLFPHYLRGWHCTRLTPDERAYIVANGMQPPDKRMLVARIGRVEAAGLITFENAQILISKNQADDESRRGRLWFCFFTPRLAGESGIGDLLRNWGGEALYNSHDRDAVMGPILRSIGVPCVVEADIPIAELSQRYSLAEKLGRRFCVNRGLETVEPVDHEDWTMRPVVVGQIKRVLIFGNPEFAALTGCEEWRQRLG